MTDPALRNARRQRQRCRLRRDQFLPVVADRIVSDRAGRIEKHVVRPPVPRGVEAQRELLAGREIEVELGIGRIADLRGRIFSRERRQSRRRGEHERLIGCFVVSRGERSRRGCWHNFRTAVEKLNDVRHMEDVLIESREEEDLVALDGPADRASDLLLPVVRLECQKRIGRAERTVAQIVERRAMHMIRSGLGDDIDHGAAGASLLRAVRIRRDAELLHHLRRELVGRAIASARLREECVVVVSPVDQCCVLKSANAAERQIAVGRRCQAARILCYPRRKQRQIRKAPPVQGEVVHRAFVEQRRHGTGLRFDQRGRARDSDFLLGAGDRQTKVQQRCAADVDVQLRRDLRRHSLCRDTRGVIARRRASRSQKLRLRNWSQ